MASKYDVRIANAVSVTDLHDVLDYQLMDLKAGVYHRFEFSDGNLLYVNDFGIRSIHVAPAGKLNANI